MEAEKTLTNEEIIRELLDLLKNTMKEQANDVFEICTYVDGLEKKIVSMTEELTSMQDQIKKMQEDTLINNAKAVLAPMKAVRKLLVSMEMHLDASIDKLDNLDMTVQFDKEKRMEHTKDKEQKAPDTEREVIYSPMVAEPQEYKYNADAFEARKTSEAKQETVGKELPKVREDKAR